MSVEILGNVGRGDVYPLRWSRLETIDHGEYLNR